MLKLTAVVLLAQIAQCQVQGRLLQEEGGLAGGAIAGIVIAALCTFTILSFVVIALCAAGLVGNLSLGGLCCCCCCCCRRGKKGQAGKMDRKTRLEEKRGSATDGGVTQLINEAP